MNSAAGILFSGQISLYQLKSERNRRTFIRFAFQVDGSAMFFHDLFADEKAQAGALPGRLTGEKHREDFFLVLGA